MKLTHCLLFALFTLSLVSGCSQRRVLVIDSEPKGASVRVNGLERGTTPVTLTVDYTSRTQPVEVQVRKQGYHSGIKHHGFRDPRDILIHLESCQTNSDKGVKISNCDPVTRQIKITSNESGTDVKVRGQIRGNAPLTAAVDFKHDQDTAEIVCVKKGFKDYKKIQTRQDELEIRCTLEPAPEDERVVESKNE